MTFIIRPLSAEPFRRLYGLADAELAAHGAMAMVADAKPGFPCRVAMRDAGPGERCILLNYEHQPAPTPYRSAHAIFVIDGVEAADIAPGEIPEVMQRRMLSLRAWDAEGAMTSADLVDGREAGAMFEAMLADPGVAYLHAHYAKRGCFAARVERA